MSSLEVGPVSRQICIDYMYGIVSDKQKHRHLRTGLTQKHSALKVRNKLHEQLSEACKLREDGMHSDVKVSSVNDS